MKLADLKASFYACMPLATGIFTGVEYNCPNDARGKRRHAVLFSPPIVPAEYGAEIAKLADLALGTNPAWLNQPKWQRTGDTIDTLTLTPSIARPCCHVVFTRGGVEP